MTLGNRKNHWRMDNYCVKVAQPTEVGMAWEALQKGAFPGFPESKKKGGEK